MREYSNNQSMYFDRKKIFFSLLLIFSITSTLFVTIYLVKQRINVNKKAYLENGLEASQGGITNFDLYSYNYAYKTVPVYTRAPVNHSYGVYDANTNKTYLGYTAGTYTHNLAYDDSVNDVEISKAGFFVAAYNHKTHTWEPSEDFPGEERGIDGIEVFSDFIAESTDAHNAVQILVDKKGYIHAFWVEHNRPTGGIMHAISNEPGEVTKGWKLARINNPPTAHAGYMVAYESKSGAWYIFFRGYESNPTGGYNYELQYEPQWMIKSTDEGKSWEKKKIIDPIKSEDKWNTIYVSGYRYVEEPREGLHIVFRETYNHIEYMNRTYYVFFDFATNKFFSPNGTDFGESIDENEYNSNGSLIFSFNSDSGMRPTDLGIKVNQNSSGAPVIIYQQCDNKCEDNKKYYKAAIWKNSNWEHNDLKELSSIETNFFDLLYLDEKYFLYTSRVSPRFIDHISEYVSTDLTSWTLGKTELIKDDVGNEERWIQLMNTVRFYNPEIYATVHKYDGTKDLLPSTFTGYSTTTAPRPLGVDTVLGSNDFTKPSVCKTFLYSNIVSGRPYFIFPKNEPCDEYTLGSNLLTSASSANFTSSMIPVKPNTKYTISYMVKPISVRPANTTNVGAALVEEYKSANNSISEMVSDGKANDLKSVDITDNNWQERKYSFTTKSETNFVRYVLTTSVTGAIKGAISYKNVKLYQEESAPQCNSWDNTWINSCRTNNDFVNKTNNCVTKNNNATVYNNVANATEKRDIVVTFSEICNTISASDSRWGEWSKWTPSSSINLGSNAGQIKVCSEYRNSIGSVKCGGIVNYERSSTAPKCTSMEDVYINNCTDNNLFNSGNKSCSTYFPNYKITNKVNDALEMRFATVDMNRICADLTDSDFTSQNSTNWMPYNPIYTMNTNDTSYGDKKVCAQFKNSVGIANCGGIIRYESLPISPAEELQNPISREPMTCNSFKNVWVNNCDELAFSKNGDSNCVTPTTNVSIVNKVTSATLMRIANVTEFQKACDSLTDSDYNTPFIPHSAVYKWNLEGTEGMKKVCLEFKNETTSVKCGGTIKYDKNKYVQVNINNKPFIQTTSLPTFLVGRINKAPIIGIDVDTLDTLSIVPNSPLPLGLNLESCTQTSNNGTKSIQCMLSGRPLFATTTSVSFTVSDGKTTSVATFNLNIKRLRGGTEIPTNSVPE